MTELKKKVKSGLHLRERKETEEKRTNFTKREKILTLSFLVLSADPEGPGICAMLLTMLSFILVLVTMPFSLCVTVKVKI